MNQRLKVFALALVALGGACPMVSAQAVPSSSAAEQTLATAAGEQKFTFLVFFKDNGPATQAMAQTVKRGTDSRADRATMAYVNVSLPAEKALVDRFGAGRAPMPLMIAVAPNGAVTRVVPTTTSDEQIEKSFVTPAMATCMKSMQQGKLVFLCVQSNPNAGPPVGVHNFQNDPQFQGRAVVVPINTADTREAELIRQLESDVANKGATTVFMAPPGVLVGKFYPTATKEELAAAMHKAGKCCDDPHCKHNHGAQQSQNSATRR